MRTPAGLAATCARMSGWAAAARGACGWAGSARPHGCAAHSYRPAPPAHRLAVDGKLHAHAGRQVAGVGVQHLCRGQGAVAHG